MAAKSMAGRGVTVGLTLLLLLPTFALGLVQVPASFAGLGQLAVALGADRLVANRP